jgi:hypothetical protein
MFDTYYYFNEFPLIPDTWPIYVTGGRFHPVPGRYHLPAGEGTYEVIGLGLKKPARIVMNTRGGCEAYTHNFMDYAMPAVEYDAGWYRWFADVCNRP